jgi:hypothetical protein
MLIRFGLHLDGLQPQPSGTAIGEVTRGPLGLLDVLEVRLGLPPVIATSADTLMAYRACLAEVDHASRFYHASFALDPINVSRTLLDWRATLYEFGWDGCFAADAPARLRDLSDVEVLAGQRVPLCRGQRARRAAVALDEFTAQIDRIELLDDLDELPPVWRMLLAKLGGVVRPALGSAAHARAGTDLRTLQDALAQLAAAKDGRVVAKRKLAGDGSFVVLCGASRDITAQAVAESIAGSAAPGDALVIAEHDGIVLDNAFERVGLPRAGFQHYSRFRAVTQVLKLALSLIWRPVSPHLLLQFLIHPIGPLSRHVRDELATAVAEQPGIGGAKWRAALTRIEARMRETFGADERRIAATQAAIAAWLGDERFDPAAGAPIAALARRAQLCSAYLAIQMNALDDATERGLFAGALAQSEALLRALSALDAQGQLRVKRVDVDRLIDEVSNVAPDPNTFAQARHVRAATDPAAVVQESAQVYWWDIAPPSRDIGYPWSRKELTWLRANGVTLFDIDSVLRHRTRRWLRPILHARDRLTLAVHDSEKGYHPLWTQITHLFDGVPEVRIDDALLNGTPPDAIGIATRRLPVRTLTAAKRWWQLPKDVEIPRRPVESYSSLSKLFDWPHGYVLRYAANLRPGRAQDLADGNRLYGNLAHRLLERYFIDNPLWGLLDAAGRREWFAIELPGLIETEAALLLEPGRGVEKQRIGTTLERALVSLIDHLRAADVVSVQPELHAEAPFKSIRIGGDIDLLLTDRRGRETVLDIKWGSEKFRADQLRANGHVQLAAYAYLRRAKRFPYQAYFIIESGHVLAQDDTVFPDAVVCTPQHSETVEELWRRVGASYDWRWKQLAGGRIEANVAFTQPTEASVPPSSALDASDDPDRFDDFVNLAGWAEFQ